MKNKTHAASVRFLLLTAAATFLLFYGCNSGASWDDALQADTFEAYQHYIETNPDGEHLAEAQMRADSLYWISISDDTAAAAFETYLEMFPDGRYQLQARDNIRQLGVDISGNSGNARVTGSNVIIRSDHTTRSPSAGVVANEGTVVQILDRYVSENDAEAVLTRAVSVDVQGERIELPRGRAISILADHDETVRASFITSRFGRAEAEIPKTDIEAVSGQTWYKIRTSDEITGWIYGGFIEEF